MNTNIHSLANKNIEIGLTDIPELPPKKITDERIRHMHGVAELMYHYYDAFHCNYLSKEDVYVLGLNHDIGYMSGKADHEAYGSNIFAEFCEFGSQNMITKCILHHGDTPQKYMVNQMCFEDEIPNELILLWWADMCIESGGRYAGEFVGFQGRLKGMKARYGENSEPYQICKETIKWLIDYIPQKF